MPYLSYPQILEWVSGNECDTLFDRWQTEADAFVGRQNNKKVSHLKLLLLCSLWYLGGGGRLTTLKRSPK